VNFVPTKCRNLTRIVCFVCKREVKDHSEKYVGHPLKQISPNTSKISFRINITYHNIQHSEMLTFILHILKVRLKMA